MKIMVANNTITRLNRFFTSGKTIVYKENETIIPRETLNPHNIYFLKKGYVHQYTLTATKTINMSIFKPNSYFPMINIFGKFTNKYSYEAMTKVETLAVSRGQFLAFIKKNPDILYDLASRLSTSLNMMAEVVESLMSFDSSYKVIRILLTIAHRFGVSGRNETVINVPLTHMDIANMIGISRETVTREVGELTKMRFIKKVKGRYVLRKLVKLRSLIKD